MKKRSELKMLIEEDGTIFWVDDQGLYWWFYTTDGQGCVWDTSRGRSHPCTDQEWEEGR